MKAYILSSEFGTVQIGSIVFQPCNHARFKAMDRKNLKGCPVVNVPDKSMTSARLALLFYGLQKANKL